MSEPTKGSAAQMRDELLNCKTLFRSLAQQVGEWRNAANNEILLLAAAIAAPRKNCERFQTWDEAKDAYWREQGDPCDWRKLGAWLFAPEKPAP